MRGTLRSVVSVTTMLFAAACSSDVLVLAPLASTDGDRWRLADLPIAAANAYRCNVLAFQDGRPVKNSSETIPRHAERTDQLERYRYLRWDLGAAQPMVQASCVIPSDTLSRRAARSFFHSLGRASGSPTIQPSFSGTVDCDYYEYDDTINCGGVRCFNAMSYAVGDPVAAWTYVYVCDNGCAIYDFSKYSCDDGGGDPGDGEGGGGSGGGGSECPPASYCDGNVLLDGSDDPNNPTGDNCTDVGYSASIGSGEDFDKAAFAAYLRANAEPASVRKCAKYVRTALCNAGFASICDGGPDALKYGPFLQKLGFSSVATGTGTGYPAGYTLQIGDIAVFTYEPYGHVAAWDGANWISDFIQQTIQPNSANPIHTYTIYRRP